MFITVKVCTNRKEVILVSYSVECLDYSVTTSNEYTKALLFNILTLKILFQLVIEDKKYSLLRLSDIPFW